MIAAILGGIEQKPEIQFREPYPIDTKLSEKTERWHFIVNQGNGNPQPVLPWSEQQKKLKEYMPWEAEKEANKKLLSNEGK